MISLKILFLVGLCGRSHQIDPETPSSAAQTSWRSVKDGKMLDLVWSDEFNVEGRSFESGKDPVFEAISRPDDVNQVSNTHIFILFHPQTLLLSLTYIHPQSPFFRTLSCSSTLVHSHTLSHTHSYSDHNTTR